MNCIICRQAEPVHGLTSIIFERDEFKLAINHIPAQVCPACGEAYLNEEVAAQVLSQAEQMAQEGLIEMVVDYA
ncbi:MAG: hypothetical protein AzoDbin1_05120 [Azoarcus sp.]|nr:hypothetical protein [Azoarcus sp.]